MCARLWTYRRHARLVAEPVVALFATVLPRPDRLACLAKFRSDSHCSGKGSEFTRFVDIEAREQKARWRTRCHGNGYRAAIGTCAAIVKKKRFSVEQIVAVLKQIELGLSVTDASRQMGVSEQAIYRWKTVYGGMESDQVRELKQLQEENARLKSLVADRDARVGLPIS